MDNMIQADIQTTHCLNAMVRDLGIAHSKTVRIHEGTIIFFKVINRALVDMHHQSLKSVVDEARLLMMVACAPEVQEHTQNLRAVCLQQ